MEELKKRIDQLRETGDSEIEVLEVLKNIPSDPNSCPTAFAKKLVTLVDNYASLKNQMNQMNGKVDKLSKSNSELEAKSKQLEKAHQSVQKERDRLQADVNKQILCKDRLENLCRELQRDKKKIEDECNLRIRAEEAKRKEFADRVNESINQLKLQIQQNQEQQQQLCEENIHLTDKLEKSLLLTKHHESALEKYEEREKTFNQLIVAKDQERKILGQKYENAVKLLEEIHKTEIEKFKAQIDELLSQRKSVEDGFIEQAKSYDSKFTQMSSLVTESQTTITKYKKEMSEVTKFVHKLHSDAIKSKDTIKSLGSDKIQLQQSNESIKKKLKTLESLCRKLQSDRKTLVAICKSNGLADEVEKQLASAENEAPAGEEPISTSGSANQSGESKIADESVSCLQPIVNSSPAAVLPTNGNTECIAAAESTTDM